MQSFVSNLDAATDLARSRRFLHPEPCTATALPQIQRQGIRWSGGAGGHDLVIKLTFENPTPEPTRATSAIVQIAPLGAFVPWRPLTAVRVPPLPPGGRRVVTAIVDPDDPKDLNVPGFGRRRAGAPQQRIGRRMMWSWLRALFPDQEHAEEVHFLGNLNVFVPGSKPVERHCSFINLDPDAANMAMFNVGDGERDDYTFSFESGQPGWDAAIRDVASLKPTPWDTPIGITSTGVVLLLKAPPEIESDHVSVWVTRASTGQRVPVEFAVGTNPPDAAQCYQL